MDTVLYAINDMGHLELYEIIQQPSNYPPLIEKPIGYHGTNLELYTMVSKDIDYIVNKNGFVSMRMKVKQPRIEYIIKGKPIIVNFTKLV